VDVCLFNPPYVPTPSEEVGSEGIEAAWAGGVCGREVIDRLLPSVARLLSPRGRLYLVLVTENRPAEVAAALAATGLSVATRVKATQARNESLSIWRCDASYIWRCHAL
jgi:release factor glutamine methyltransferase